MKNTAKTNKREPNKKALNQNLADKKAEFEENGWSFSHDETLGWEGAKDGHKIGHFPKLGDLLEDLEKMKSIEERFAPKITEENRIPDNTEIVFDDDGTEREGYIFSSDTTKTQYLVKVAIGGEVYNYYLKPNEFTVKNPPAEKSNVVAGDFAKKDEPAQDIPVEDKCLQILLAEYFADYEIEKAREMPANDAKKYLTKLATEDLRGKLRNGYGFVTRKGKIYIHLEGTKLSEEPDAVFTIAAIASKVVESLKDEAAKKSFKLKSIVDNLLVLRFNLDLADEAILQTDAVYGSAELAKLNNNFAEAETAYETAISTESASSAEVMDKFNEINAKRLDFTANGWEFNRDGDIWNGFKQVGEKKGGGTRYGFLDDLLTLCAAHELGFKEKSKSLDLGDIPVSVHKEKAALEEKGWTFTQRPDLRWDFSADGVEFKDKASLVRAVEGARSLQGTREREDGVEKLKEIAFEEEVEKLLVFTFKNAQILLTDFKAFYKANESQMKSKISTAAVDKGLEIYSRMLDFQTHGWEFSLDGRENWAATKQFDKVSDGATGYNSLERLLNFCANLDEKHKTKKLPDYAWTFSDRLQEEIAAFAQYHDIVSVGKTEQDYAEIVYKDDNLENAVNFISPEGLLMFSERDESISETIPESVLSAEEYFERFPVKPAEAKPPTLAQTATLSDWIGRGWHIAKNNSGIWEGYKEIGGKKVECQNTDLDKLFGQIQQLDPKPEEKKLKPSETLPTSEIKKVRFELTDEDIRLKTNSLMENFRVAAKKTADFSEIKKLHKKDIEALDKERGDLISQIDSRVEFRPVECEIEYDLERGEAIYYRPDNGEQVDRRSMTKEEMRTALAAAERTKQRELFR